MHFELQHLESYDDEALLNEARRVSSLLGKSTLSIKEFSKHAKVHGSTLQRRFGGWRNALKAAGLDEKVDNSSLRKNRDEILEAIKHTAKLLGKNSITLREFEAHSGITGTPARRIFGSWAKALSAAGIEQSPLGKRYTDEECFENMLAIWTHYGRPPQHDEMGMPPSSVGAKAYVSRWGTWRKALAAFVERVNADTLSVNCDVLLHPNTSKVETEKSELEIKRGPRSIPLGLRYYVLKRDDFRCVACGASPAISRGVVLHIDHIEPWSLGGPTVAENLRTLCEGCNLGKGASPA